MMVAPYPTRKGMIHGGVEAVTFALVRALVQLQGISDLVVLSFYRGRPPSQAITKSRNLTVIQMPAQRRLAGPSFLALDWIRARLVSAIIQPDIAHGQGINSAGFIATHLGRPSVVTVHGVTPVEVRMGRPGPVSHLRVKLADRRVRSVLRNANVFISISQYDARLLAQHVAGEVVSIPNPIMEEFFLPAVCAGEGVLFAGVLSDRKNVAGLVRAFKEVERTLPAAKLTIVGPEGQAGYASGLHDLIKTLGLAANVECLGHVETDVLIARLRESALVVLFSNEETSPTIIAQAMAAGKPVVASDVGGVQEMVVDGETGWLVPRGDEDTLARKMRSLLADPDLRLRMGSTARRLAQERCSPVVAKRTVKVYEKLKCSVSAPSSRVREAE